MQTQRAHVFQNMLALLRRRQLLRFLEEGEFPIHPARHQNVRNELYHKLRDQVQNEVPRQHQNQNLHAEAHQLENLTQTRADIALLIGQINGVLVAEQVRPSRIQHIQAIDQPQMLDTLAALDKDVQKGQ